jgi:HNH endonuclease
MTSRRDLEQQVEARAAGRCEYCRMHQSLQGATFHVEHVVPRSRGGHSQLDNLAWACPSCNLHKANRIEVIDPDTGRQVPLFHPRVDDWQAHFRWDGYRVVGQTPIGRATVAALALNHPRRLQIRQAEELFELFPPTEGGA